MESQQRFLQIIKMLIFSLKEAKTAHAYDSLPIKSKTHLYSGNDVRVLDEGFGETAGTYNEKIKDKNGCSCAEDGGNAFYGGFGGLGYSENGFGFCTKPYFRYDSFLSRNGRSPGGGG